MKCTNHNLVAVLILGLSASPLFAQGPLTPPGAPAPTMKTLAQIEPRTPITNIPYIISVPGSYYLTTNLQASGNITGIVVSVDNVTIDLNGFSLQGIGGSGAGIFLFPFLNTRLTIRNGTVAGWAGSGVSAGSCYDSSFEKLHLLFNAGTGLVAGASSTVRDCQVDGNALLGIFTGSNSVVRGCTAQQNGQEGISAGAGSAVTECVAQQNGVVILLSPGIFAAPGSTIRGCVAIRNRVGIVAGFGCTISECAVSTNSFVGIQANACTIIGCTANANGIGIDPGSDSLVKNCGATFNLNQGITAGTDSTIADCTSAGNGGDGINVGDGCTVSRCTANFNVGHGIHATSDCSVENNTIHFNGYAASPGDGIHTDGSNNRIDGNHITANHGYGIKSFSATADFIMRNTSIGNATNYNPSSGTYFGPLSTPGTVGASPWANF